MAVYVHRCGYILMAQALLCDLYIDTLQQHDRCAKVSQIMETALRQICLVLKLGKHLAKIFWIDRLA